MLKEIEQNLKDYSQFIDWFSTGLYTSKAIEECSRCELRGALSYYFLNVDAPLIDIIVTQIVSKVNYNWPQLSIIEEGILQKKLRNNGYNLIECEQLPTNSLEMQFFLIKTTFKQYWSNRYYNLNLPTRIGNFFNLRYNFLMICVAIMLYYHNWTLLLWSMCITYILWALSECVKHEYLEHRYLIPKNELVRYCMDIFMYITVPASYVDKARFIRTHNYHHIYWKSDKDEFTAEISESVVPGFKDPILLVEPPEDNMRRLLAEYSCMHWLFKNLRVLELAVAAIVVLNFGFEYFFYLLVLPLFLKTPLEYQHDLYFRFGERDYWWLYPIALNQSYHLTHHNNFRHVPANWSEVFNGPRWIKYFNPQYYFLRLFFKLKSQ